MSLDILYQDQWFICINKPAGMLVHPGREPEPVEQIAMKALRDQLGYRIYPIHRLDRPTSGVLLFACDRSVVPPVKKQFEDQSIEKMYAAVVLGESEEAWISHRVLHREASIEPCQIPPSYPVQSSIVPCTVSHCTLLNQNKPGQHAETHFKRNRICQIGGRIFSILSVFPKTGRFHQIRKHLAADGFPIVGDYLYGDVDEMNDIALMINQPRLMLHAQQLTFFHPIEGVPVTVTCPLPERFGPFL